MAATPEEETALTIYPTPRDAFERIVKELESAGLDYAILGALARAAWGRERRTTDIDFTMHVPPDRFQFLVDLFARLGFDRYLGPRMPPSSNSEVPDLISFMGKTEDPADRLRVDILVSKVAYQDLTLGRKLRARSQNVSCWAISPEDLIVHKLISHRNKDLDDIEEVIASRRKNRLKLDWAYIRKWAKEWEVEKHLKPFLPKRARPTQRKKYGNRIRRNS